MWLLCSRKSRRCSSARSHRPSLEALEDRCLLSAGSLDPTFGNGAGYVTTSSSASADPQAHSVLIQPNGDIVALGSAQTSAGSWDFLAQRYNPDGSLDTSFGTGGIATTSFGSSSSARGPSSVLYPAGTANAGDILQEGYAGPNPDSSPYQALVRYNTNGTLDTTFGTGGEVMTAFPGVSSFGTAAGGVVLTSSGQIVALSGITISSSPGGGTFALARYNANGSLDTSFGQGGYDITTVPNNGAPGVMSLLQQPNGDLIVSDAGGANDEGSTWYLYRFTANGALDNSFGNQGIVTISAPGGGSSSFSAALYPDAGTPNDGKIVLVGQLPGNGPVDFARFNANGSLDTTFGTGGLMQTQLNMGDVWQAALDANGRIVATGTDSSATSLARFNVDGTPDATFGNGGLVTTTFGTSSIGMGLAIYPNAGLATDGDIVVVGRSTNGTNYNVLVARYLGQATSPYFEITGPSSVTAGTAGTYTISVFNPDGSADTGYSGTVHITSSDPKAVLPANFTISGDTATFSATLETAGPQFLTATDTVTSGISGGDSSITITPAAAAQIVLTAAPSSVKSGKKFSLEVTIEDAFGNIVTGYVGTIHFSSSDGTATLPANYTFTASDAGVHTFTNVFIFRRRGTQSLTATDTHNGALTVTDDINVA